jgi:hypothetical protein
MQNLTQFKKRIAQVLADGGDITTISEQRTAFKHIHPFFALYPDGVKVATIQQDGQKVGRVQSNSFTMFLPDGRESWMDWGKASQWTFPDSNTAQWTESYESGDHSHTSTLTFKF